MCGPLAGTQWFDGRRHCRCKTWEKLRENVRKYQNALQNKGYDVGEIDGIASDKTYNAICNSSPTTDWMQTTCAARRRRPKLFGASQGGGTTSSTLKLGSDGFADAVPANHAEYNGIFAECRRHLWGKRGSGGEGLPVQKRSDGRWDLRWRDLGRTVFPVSGGRAGHGCAEFVNVAKHEAQIGFHEDNGNNINPYGQWYGNNGSAWCAMFVSFCAEQAGILDTIVPRYAYTPSGANWYRNRDKYHKRTSSYSPKVGDTVFFFDASKGRIAHTGIVTLVTSSLIYTIEGNASDGVIERNYNRSDSYIDGYGDNGLLNLPSDFYDTPPTDVRDIAPFIEELEDISLQSGYTVRETALNVLDYLRQYKYGSLDGGSGDILQWSVAIRPLNDIFFKIVDNALEAKRKTGL